MVLTVRRPGVQNHHRKAEFVSTAQLEPLNRDAWSAKHARHLLNRAGFGLPRDLWERFASLGMESSIQELVYYETQFESMAKPSLVLDSMSRKEERAQYAGLTEDERREVRNQRRRDERRSVAELKSWWIDRMLTTRRPLQEKLALFWHGHFATSAQKVQEPLFNWQVNDIARRNASGNFKTLTIEMGQSPAMLRYLDNDRSTKRKPNENWARELMELFTMGVGHYSEDDIKNSARAFTGWTRNHEKFVYREDQHDFGEKTFMGRTGKFDGWDIIDIIFEQPATAEYIAGELWTYFAYPNPEREIVQALAATLRDNDYEMKPLLEQIFASQAFYGNKSMGRQIKSPAQLIVQLCSEMGVENPPAALVISSMRELGQDLFYPPNVKGWDGGRAWINANALLYRYNLPGRLIAPRPTRTDRMRRNQRNKNKSDDTMMMAERRPNRPVPWDANVFFSQFDFSTVGECVEALSEHFLSVPLSAEQRATIIEAMGAHEDTLMTPDSVSGKRMQTALHLLTSSAEYQLC
jgi:uncharacterized protein (DUF1800 family)